MKTWLFIAACVAATHAYAQTSDLMSKGNKAIYTSVKSNVLKAADAVSDADYAYKPTDKVRTFGELFAHIADGQYEFCSAALSDKSEHASVEKTKKTKGEIVEALK